MDDVTERKRRTAALVKRCGRRAEIIVGVAGPSMVWAMWVAEALSLPAAYLREPKDHGRGRHVEGATTKDRRCVLIIGEEDTSELIPQLEARSVKVIGIGH